MGANDDGEQGGADMNPIALFANDIADWATGSDGTGASGIARGDRKR